MLGESNLQWLDLEDKLTAEKAKDAEYISICIYTYGVHYVLRHRYPPALAQVTQMTRIFLASFVSRLKTDLRPRQALL